ncbi:nucleoside-diphosphate kinase [uncultured Clostridium sp.]|jgi:nucleoside-diphosphate kinase|uniref:nucleoside-diphosphate kinase n=1 Tax=uncultured Clostridium sp. TaxID=59620 RepID=UPI002603F0D4|nr:nucleoside-diphosphate kinase [uncultured Clostridium sp.]
MEKSLVLIKPDAVERNLIGEITSIYEKAGLKVINMRMETVSYERAVEHYKEHEGREYFKPLIEYIQRSPLVALVLEGADAISKIRELNGATKNPDKGTIREMYSLSGRENSVHASDSEENATREIKIWF